MSSLFRLAFGKWLFASLCLPVILAAQPQMTEKSDAMLVAELKGMMLQGLVEARPILLELLKRLDGKPDRETYLFLIGLSYQDEYADKQDASKLEKATEYYSQYLNDFPQGIRGDFVRFNLAGAYADLNNFEGAVEHYQHLYEQSANPVLRSESRMRMAELYLKHDKAAEGIPLYLEVFSSAVYDAELKAKAATWLLQGYLAANQPEEILPYLRYLTGDYEAVYDPAFNLTLLKAGDDLFSKQNYDQAILLYSFVKRRSETIQFYEDLIDELVLKVRYMSPDSDQYIVVDGQLQAAKARLEAVREIREYDVDLEWRIARVYKETKRTWESLWGFVHLYEDYPDHDQVEDFLYTAYNEARELPDDVMTEQLALDYLAQEGFLKFRGQVVLGLAQVYAKARRQEDLFALVDGYLEDPESFVVAAQLINLIGSYYLVDSEYLALRDYVAPLSMRFQDKEPLYEALRYWTGLSYLLLADYGQASKTMAAFISDYDQDSVYYEDTCYRYGVALFGEQEFQASEAQFLKFIEAYPGSGLRGEAELYIGDLQRDRGALAEAAEHYRAVESYTDNDAFIAKATFALTEVLEMMGQPEQAVDELIAYIERYGLRGQIGEAYFRMGMIYDRIGWLDERFKVHAQAIDELIGDAYRYAVDELIENYVKDYVRYQISFNDSISLLNRLIDDRDFRIKFLNDRAYQYQFMQSAEGINVDRDLAQLLVRDRNFRAQIIETVIPIDPETGKEVLPNGEIITAEMAEELLDQLLQRYKEKAESIADFEPEARFRGLVERGQDNDNVVTEMRAQVALDRLSEEPLVPHFEWEDLEVAPPAVILWEAAKYQGDQAQEAKALYQIILKQHPFSKSVYDALMALGELTYSKALLTNDEADWEEALGYYSLITERYAMRAKTAVAHLRKGQIYLELDQDENAIEVFGQILRNPKWKGLDHAKAHLELGLAYRRLGKHDEAHGFFERLIVAYGGYAEVVSWAYYYDMLTLEAMNEAESVQQLIEEYKTRLTVLSDTEAYAAIKEKYEL